MKKVFPKFQIVAKICHKDEFLCAFICFIWETFGDSYEKSGRFGLLYTGDFG